MNNYIKNLSASLRTGIENVFKGKMHQAAKELLARTLGHALDEYLVCVPYTFFVVGCGALLLQGDNLVQTAYLLALLYVVFKMAACECAGALRVFEHIGEVVAHLAHKR